MFTVYNSLWVKDIVEKEKGSASLRAVSPRTCSFVISYIGSEIVPFENNGEINLKIEKGNIRNIVSVH